MNIKKIFNPKSIWKGLRDTGIIIGSGGAIAGLAIAQSPEALSPLALALGPYGAIALFLVPWAAKAAQDAIKHRDKGSYHDGMWSI